MRKVVVVISSILVGIFIIWFCCKPSDIDRVAKKEKNVLHFGTCADYPPMEYYRDGILTGFEIELVKSIAKSLGKEIVFEDMTFSSLQVALEKGFLDAFVAAFGITPEGREKFDFTIPYYIEGLVLLHKKSDPIASLQDFSEKKVAYQLSNQIKKGLEENIPEAELISTDRIDVAMEMFKAGHADCVCMDIFIADGYCEKNSDWTYYVPDALKVSEGTAIAFPKGSSLRTKFNKILKTMEASGELQALRNEWQLRATWKLPNEYTE
ncbi:MAG: ABC transporter substrate-binding protein [Puniceicoccales bacterium]|jgi:polar amino acid transport system substrate-binding protein|nr:ABC transporter substrate-binding protein [Puniceicoccales bacterium]